jgi:hypothetical protein
MADSYIMKNGRWVKAPKRKTRIVNTTSIPTEVIRDLLRFVRPPGIKAFRVQVVKSSTADYAGWGGSHGIKLRINENARYPRKLRLYQYGQLKGRRHYLGSFLEMLIYFTAHELMHTRQGQKGPMRGRVWGARGRYSEIETECWAIQKLREWRRQW